ncbi:MAG: SUMF1/EgtB/PvdO family nonheme iron enzyme [Rhodocyclaceae bacterium]|nr:SUMF1/EgtB/PvdO family nonheme iron enzyme [Rhodocyclaceae bacterium]
MDPLARPGSRPRIFVSYRRQDSEHATGRLVDHLQQAFPDHQVFQDTRDIALGADWVEVLETELASCAAVVVVIGRGWLSASDEDGRPRLDDEDDPVRVEVETALRRRLPIFPLLLDGTTMPRRAALPAALAPLVRRNAYPLTTGHWHEDVAKLVRHLKLLPAIRDGAPLTQAVEAVAVAAGDGVGLRPGTVFRDGDDGPAMVVVPAGEFLMGSAAGEEGRDDEEGPQHRVHIARPFAVGQFPVTFEEWDACLAAGGSDYRPGGVGWGRGRRPVIQVDWHDARAYAQWLSEKTGKPYRLLSEAEWEYAARAGSSSRYPWGDEPGSNEANFVDSGSDWSGKQTAPVGSFAPNAFGLHDMIGNVWEWVEDPWHDDYRGAPGDGRVWTGGDSDRRVVRGGSWGSIPDGARSAIRGRNGPGNRYGDLGFRLARTL